MEIKVLASGSSGNAYRISDGTTSLLLDAGIPLKAIQVGCDFKVTQIKGCFVTHNHQDHSKAARDLMRLGVDIYTSQGTIDACRLTGHRAHPLKELQEITVGTFKVLPFDVQHDAPDPLGFLFTSNETGELTGRRSSLHGSSRCAVQPDGVSDALQRMFEGFTSPRTSRRAGLPSAPAERNRRNVSLRYSRRSISANGERSK